MKRIYILLIFFTALLYSGCSSMIYDDLSECPQGVRIGFYVKDCSGKAMYPEDVDHLRLYVFNAETGLYLNTYEEKDIRIGADQRMFIPLKEAGKYHIVAIGGSGDLRGLVMDLPKEGETGLKDFVSRFDPKTLSSHLYIGMTETPIEVIDRSDLGTLYGESIIPLGRMTRELRLSLDTAYPRDLPYEVRVLIPKGNVHLDPMWVKDESTSDWIVYKMAGNISKEGHWEGSVYIPAIMGDTESMVEVYSSNGKKVLEKSLVSWISETYKDHENPFGCLSVYSLSHEFLKSKMDDVLKIKMTHHYNCKGDSIDLPGMLDVRVYRFNQDNVLDDIVLYSGLYPGSDSYYNLNLPIRDYGNFRYVILSFTSYSSYSVPAFQVGLTSYDSFIFSLKDMDRVVKPGILGRLFVNDIGRFDRMEEPKFETVSMEMNEFTNRIHFHIKGLHPDVGYKYAIVAKNGKYNGEHIVSSPTVTYVPEKYPKGDTVDLLIETLKLSLDQEYYFIIKDGKDKEVYRAELLRDLLTPHHPNEQVDHPNPVVNIECTHDYYIDIELKLKKPQPDPIPNPKPWPEPKPWPWPDPIPTPSVNTYMRISVVVNGWNVVSREEVLG